MSGRFDITRRTFLATSVITPLATQLSAAPLEMRYMRLVFVKGNEAPDRVEFQFSNTQDFAQKEDFRLIAPFVSGEADQPWRLVAPDKLTRPSLTAGAIRPSNDWYIPVDEEITLELRAGTTTDSLAPAENAPVLSLTMKQVQRFSTTIWVVRLNTWFWRQSVSGKGRSIGINYNEDNASFPSLWGVLAREEGFGNVFDRRFVGATASVLTGLPVTVGGNSRVTCSLAPLPSSLADQKGGARAAMFAADWMVEPIGNKKLQVVREETRCTAISFTFPVVEQKDEVAEFLELSFQSQATFSTDHGSKLEIIPDEDSAPVSTSVVKRTEGDKPVFSCAIPAAQQASVVMSHRGFELGGLVVSEDDASLGALRYVSHQPARVAKLHVDLPLEVDPASVRDGGPQIKRFQSYSFGIVGIHAKEARFAARLGSSSIDSFRVSGKIAELGVALNEEANSIPQVYSSLTWVEDEVETQITLRLSGVPDGAEAQPTIPSEEEEGRSVPVQQSAILIDWRVGETWNKAAPFEHAPLDLALEGASLEVHRDTDLLSLVFRFFNFRLLSGSKGTHLRMEKANALVEDLVYDFRPDRPILSMEVPGGHILKESHRTQLIKRSDLPQPNNESLMTCVPAECGTDFLEMNTADLFSALRTASLDERVALRREIYNRIIATLDASAKSKFENFAKAFEVAVKKDQSFLNLPWNKGLSKTGPKPPDQAIYIGSDMMDRDHWEIARTVARTLSSANDYSFATLTMMDRLRRAETPEIRELARKATKTVLNYENLTNLHMRLTRERRLGDFPEFTAFHTFYSENREPFLPEVFPGMDWLETSLAANDPDRDLHQRRINALLGEKGAAGSGLLFEFFQDQQKLPQISRSRRGEPSRICYLWDTRDTPTEDTPFSLSALLSRDNADLSVPLRSQRLFEVDENGVRRPIFDFGQTLAQQGIEPRAPGASASTSVSRMADVYRSARRGVAPWETRLQLISRIDFSIPQDALLDLRSEVPTSFYSRVPDGSEPGKRPNLPSWSVSLASKMPRQGLRAIASPDFNPLHYLKFAQGTVRDDTNPALSQTQLDQAYATPDRSSAAPWSAGRALEVDGQIVWIEPKEQDDFQNALSRYHRHSLVATSVPGLPTIGDIEELDENGQPIEAEELEGDTGSLPAPPGYLLDDLTNFLGNFPEGRNVRIRQSIIRQQDFGFSQVTLSPFGPSTSISAPFLNKVPGRNTADIALYDAQTVSQLNHDSTYGEDEETLVLETGYLFPLGHKAALLQHTKTGVMHPDALENRDYPATKELTRTTLQVSEPLKSQWYGQALDGRERPFDRCQILTEETPDLALKFSKLDDLPLGSDPKVEPDGRINLGTNGSGLVFWPRIAEVLAGTFKFQVLFDDGPAAVEMPLIYVGFGAATNPEALRRLCEYYMGLNADNDGAFLREVNHAGARRRYANEILDTDTTYETESWIFGAEGRPTSGSSAGTANLNGSIGSGLIAERAERLGNPHVEFRFDALLAATDQPPFYPFMQSGKVRVDRIARQTGQRRGPVLGIAYDTSYLQRKRPKDQDENAPILPPADQADLVLGVHKHVRMDVGARGASVGGISRPAGFLAGLARREGPLLHMNAPKKTDDPFAVVPTQLSGFFSKGGTPPPAGSGVAGSGVAEAQGEDNLLDDRIAQKAAGSLTDLICEMLGDPDMKILGVFTICEIIGEVVGALADNMPIFEEIQDYGGSLLEGGLDVIQSEVIEPLRFLLTEIDKRLATAMFDNISPASLLPDLTNNLKALNAGLEELGKAEANAGVLVKATEVAASGKAVIRSLDNLANDPVSPLRSGLQTFLESELGQELPVIENFIRNPSDIGKALEEALLTEARERILDPNGTLNPKLMIGDLKILASSSLQQALGVGNDAENRLNAFIMQSVELAANTVFKNKDGNDIGSFKTLIEELDPQGAGRDKWDKYAEGRIDALKTLIEDVSEGPGQVLLDLVAQYDTLVAILTRLADEPRRLEAEFEEIIDELSDDAKQSVEQTLEQAKLRVEAVRARAEQQLIKLRNDLVKQIFGLNIEVAEDLFVKTQDVIDTLSQDSVDPGSILASIGAVLKAVDDAYFAGAYTNQVRQRLDTAGQSIIAPIHKTLCMVFDYVNAAGSWISVEANNRIPTAKEITSLFAEIRNETAGNPFETLASFIPEPSVQGSDNNAPKPSGELAADLLRIMSEALKGIERLAISAAGENLSDIANLLKALGADVSVGYNSTLDALESYLLSLAAAFRVRDGTKLDCPSEANLLLRFGRGDFLEKERVLIETQLTSWVNVVNETEAMSRSLVDELARIERTFGSETRQKLDVALVAAKDDQAVLVNEIEALLEVAEVALCDRLVCAITPLALMILRSVDRIVSAVSDEVLDAKAQALESLQSTLAAVQQEITRVGNSLPILSPIMTLAVNALSDVTAKLKPFESDTSGADRALADLIEILEVYYKTARARKNLPLDFKSNRPEDRQKSATLELAVKEVKALPDKLAASILGSTTVATQQGAGSNTGSQNAKLAMAEAHAGQSMLALAQSLRFDLGEGLDNAAEELKGTLEQKVWELIKGPLKPILEFLGTDLYEKAEDIRKSLLDRLEPGNNTEELILLAGEFLLGVEDLRELFVTVDNRNLTRKQVSQVKVALLKYYDENNKKFPSERTASGVGPELLTLELKHLTTLKNDESGKQVAALKALVDVFSGRSHRPAIQQIIETVTNEIERIISGEVTIRIDLADLRDEIEKILLGLVPSKITNKMTHDINLKDVGGIFLPKGDKKFKLKAVTTVDLLDLGASKIDTEASLSQFNIALFGEPFDVFTMKFSGAKFTLKSGQEPDYDITFESYEIGEKAEFIEELAGKMGAGGSGPYIQPALGFPGIEAGYRMNLPAITLGAATFMNVGLVAGAILPFDKREALFTVGISTRQDPFIILIGVWGGGGHFALYSNGKRMVGFDVSFVFAGGGAIAAGPLNLEGRVSVGIFLRQIGDISETSGDFFAGGSGNIWIFGFSASLRVRVGQDGAGNMVGSAVFSFSFSLGLAKVRFAITLFKKEGKGLEDAGGEQTAGLFDDSRQVRWASSNTRGPLHDQLMLAAASGAGEAITGEAKIVIKVPRFEDDFGAWKGNFASQHSVLKGCLEALENA